MVLGMINDTGFVGVMCLVFGLVCCVDAEQFGAAAMTMGENASPDELVREFRKLAGDYTLILCDFSVMHGS